jgi:hypothetical protein
LRASNWPLKTERGTGASHLEGTGEITAENAYRATRYWTTRSDRDPELNARPPSDLEVLDGGSEEEWAKLIAQRLEEWKSASNRI